MTTAELATILESTSAVAILLVLTCKLFPQQRCDLFRQEMFGLRDDLFDYAKAGKISFNHPAYRLLRQSLNGNIRYAHRLTFFRICVTTLLWNILSQKPDLRWAHGWEIALKCLPDDVRADMQSFHSVALNLVVKRVITGSPALMLLLTISSGLGLGKIGVRNFRRLCYESGRRTVSIFVDPRLLQEDAARMATA